MMYLPKSSKIQRPLPLKSYFFLKKENDVKD